MWLNSSNRILAMALNDDAVPCEIELVPIGCTILRRTCFGVSRGRGY